jgi:hypothetical protein
VGPVAGRWLMPAGFEQHFRVLKTSEEEPDMVFRVLGIDPGEKGGLALVVGPPWGLEKAWVMPWKDEGPDVVELDALIARSRPNAIFLEQTGAYAMSQSSAYSFGRTCGMIELVCQQSGIELHKVKPAEWSKVMHEGTDKRLKPKEKSLLKIVTVFPGESFLASSRSKKPHDGLVDAALIGAFGVDRLRELFQKEVDKWGL